MEIWVDADACAVMSKEILFRACQENPTILILITNCLVYKSSSLFIHMQQVESGFDVNDNKIVKN